MIPVTCVPCFSPPFSISGIVIVSREVPPVNVVDEAVVIIIDSVECLAGVGPHRVSKIGMLVVYPLIEDRYDYR